MITGVDPRTGRKVERARNTALSLLASRPAWLVAAVVALIALGIGSVHPQQPSSSARIAHLDSVIKCPSCVDLSIAQSDAPIAVGLRSEVAAWVHAGLSDARIEQLVVARFGEQALLVPSGSGADVLLWAVPAAALGAAAVVLAGYLWRRRRLEVPL
ncbi:MAG: cytochrome c-type biogenesis protein CcmH [Acidimicrobiales bacterium]|jgi:cytochrome c-type biogenesis protein CcmH/NrfF